MAETDYEALEAEARETAHGLKNPIAVMLTRLADAIGDLRRERDEAVADNAALLQDMTVAYGYLREPRMDGSHVPSARDILEKRRRESPGAALLERLAAMERVRENAPSLRKVVALLRSDLEFRILAEDADGLERLCAALDALEVKP